MAPITARLRLMVEGPLLAAPHGLQPETAEIEEPFFLAGPVGARVASTWEAFAARYGMLAPETFARVSEDLLRLRGATRRMHLEGKPALRRSSDEVH
jgi:hypothetical protein